MTSEYKLNEARFFLTQIDLHYNDLEECDYCVSAFLHATHDIIDHTFEEYALEFDITVQSYRRKKIAEFIETAKKQNKKDALGFIEIYIKELRTIYTQPIASSLLHIRNQNTHKETSLSPLAMWAEQPDGSKRFEGRSFLSEVNLVTPRFETEFKSYVTSQIKKPHEHGKMLGIDLPLISTTELAALFNNVVEILTDTGAKDVYKQHLCLLEKFVGAIRAKYQR